MADLQFPVGTLVEHPKKPEWGPGKVVKATAERLYIVWRDLPDREAKKLIPSVLVLAVEQQDAILDNLPPRVEKDGNLIFPAKRVTFQEATDNFSRRFPQGFQDLAYIGTLTEGERHYKWVAHEYFIERLGNGKFRELLAEKPISLGDEVIACIAKVNLLYTTEFLALKDALKEEDAAQKYLATLADLLEADLVSEEVFEPYAEAVCRLPAQRSRVATWPVTTVLPFLAKPQQHVLVKPEQIKKVADALGFEINYRSEPNWRTYRSVIQMAEAYKEKLAPLAPVDVIDVQSFFWVSCGGYE